MSSRRQFIKIVPVGAVALLGSRLVLAQAMVDEKDPQAAALGYVSDSTKADQKKYPKHTADQNCGSCALYQGKAAATGNCPLFAGKQVSAKAWCSAYSKKA